MAIKKIHNEDEYFKALERLDAIFDAGTGTPEWAELENLAELLDAYENKNFPIDRPDPIEAIKFRKEQLSSNE